MNPSETRSRKGSLLAVFLTLFGLTFISVTVVGTLVTFILPESFASVARIRIAWTKPLTETAEQSRPESGSDYERLVQTECEVIQSETILNQVVDALDLNTEWGKRFFDGLKLKSAESLFLLKRRLEVRSAQRANVVEIRVFSENPREAATIANTIASIYVASLSESANGPKGTIIDSAVPSLKPARPNKPWNIVAAMVLGAGLGLLLAGAVTGICFLWKRRKQCQPPIS